MLAKSPHAERTTGITTDSGTSATSYLPRYLDQELHDLFPQLPAIAIDGAKGVGKTETAMRWTKHLLRLDNPEINQLVAADTVNQLTKHATICVDEWQKYPPVWDAVRRLVDQKTTTRFLLTGSATPVAGTDTHSGAGRIASLRLRPLSLAERPHTRPSVFISHLFAGQSEVTGTTDFRLADYARSICETGLPQIFSATPRARRALLDGYIQRIIDRDIPDQGVAMRKPQSLRAWMSAYAAASSTTASYTAILDATSPAQPDKLSKNTTQVVRDLLTQLWILDPVPGWMPTGSPLKRLTLGPKHQLFDPGIAAALTNTTTEMLLSGQPGTMELFGQLFESLATLSARVAGQAAEAKCYHLCTRGGEHEVDLILERYDGKVIAFEVKLAPTVSENDLTHLRWLGTQLGERLIDRVVITSGQHAFRRPDGIAVVPLALLG